MGKITRLPPEPRQGRKKAGLWHSHADVDLGRSDTDGDIETGSAVRRIRNPCRGMAVPAMNITGGMQAPRRALV
jgi:hypothetical protein